jgi:hypothetical protein
VLGRLWLAVQSHPSTADILWKEDSFPRK